jgi:uncharacterized protein YycO
MMTKLIQLIIIIIISAACSNGRLDDNSHEQILFTGDLLFCPAPKIDESDFSIAINAVTQTNIEQNYTHIGIVKITNNTIMIIHSTPEKGVVRENFESFIKDYPEIHIYRLHKDYHDCIPKAIEKAFTYIGNDYDHSFRMQEKEQYCSGLIYTIFKDCDVFELKPMSFINPATGQTDEFWIKYYANLNEEVPEGVDGCNPNDMAKNSSISFVGEYGLKD